MSRDKWDEFSGNLQECGFWIPTFVGMTVGGWEGWFDGGRDGGGTFVKVPPHPLKTFEFGEVAVRVGLAAEDADFLFAGGGSGAGFVSTNFDNRKTVEGILWIARTGAPWWDRPPYFGKGNAGRRRFRRWVQSGVLARLLDALPEDLDWQIVMVDGTFVKIQQRGDGPGKGGVPRRRAGKAKPSVAAGAD